MIVDFRVIPPLPKTFEAFIVPPEHHAGYARLYNYDDGPRSLLPYALDIERVSFRDRVSSRAQLLRYVAEAGVSAYLEILDAVGIDVVVVPATDLRSTFGSYTSNDSVAELQRQAGGRIFGIAAVDPHREAEAVWELERAVRELNLKGLTVGPWEHKIHAEDRLYYPLYEKCVELNIPCILHVSTNLSPKVPMEYGHPRHLDQVAVDFPDLKIIANHGGWPWVLELMAVALRHPNVYISPAGMRPKYYTIEASGWTPLVHYGNNLLQDRVLFGSLWPLMPFRRTIDEIRDLPLRDAVKEKWLGGNAARLLGLV